MAFVGIIFIIFVIFIAAIVYESKDRAACFIAIVATLIAWFSGLLLDANIRFNPEGYLCLRILFPILAMGLCVIRGQKK